LAFGLLRYAIGPLERLIAASLPNFSNGYFSQQLEFLAHSRFEKFEKK
jgi:hypothetical protein